MNVSEVVNEAVTSGQFATALEGTDKKSMLNKKSEDSEALKPLKLFVAFLIII